MAKISPVAAKYIIHSSITIDGVVDKPDVIGAIFGQTEGLLGSELELRELQRSGRIGRIEVNMNTISGKTAGEIVIPSSLDKTETAIVGAALEIIQRIGPCNAKIQVQNIEDVRTSKRQFVIERAKELLRDLTQTTLPDSQEIADEVSQSVRMLEIIEFGPERLAAGPGIMESDEIIVVEGRADVLTLLRHGFKNAIAMNGTSCPETIKELTRKKSATLFCDGDRGGDLIIREVLSVTEIDFICKAPDGKEVEELTKKEIHKAIRGRITAEQVKLDMGLDDEGGLKENINSLHQNGGFHRQQRPNQSQVAPKRPEQPQTSSNAPKGFSRAPAAPLRPALNRTGPKEAMPRENKENLPRDILPKEAPSREARESRKLSSDERKKLKETMEDLFGTRGACIFDEKLNVLGKVPLSELSSTVKSLNGGIYALALDGTIDLDLIKIAEKLGVEYVVGTGSKVKESQKVNILTDDQI